MNKLSDKLIDHVARFYPAIKILTMVSMFFATTFIILNVAFSMLLSGVFSSPTAFMTTISLMVFANAYGIWTLGKISKRYHSKYAQ
jgi:uncharacterized membrane protein YqjE